MSPSAFTLGLVVAGLHGHWVPCNERVRRDSDSIDYGAGSYDGMVSDMRSTFDHAVGAHKNMVLQYDRMAGNIIPQFQASPVGVGDINGNKGRDIAMVANPQGRALSVDQRKRANEHVLAEFGLADDPNQRVKLIGTERRSSGEGALKLQIFHNGSVG